MIKNNIITNKIQLNGFDLEDKLNQINSGGADLTEYVKHSDYNHDDYALRSEILNPLDFVSITDIAVYALKSDLPTDYITNNQLNNKGYLTQDSINHLVTTEMLLNYLKVEDVMNFDFLDPSDLNGYVKASDLPDHSIYITTVDLDNKLSKYVSTDSLAGYDYATEQYVIDAIDNIPGYNDVLELQNDLASIADNIEYALTSFSSCQNEINLLKQKNENLETKVNNLEAKLNELDTVVCNLKLLMNINHDC